MKQNKYFIWLGLILALIILIIMNLSLGAYEINFSDSLKALINQGSSEDINIIRGVRLPRTIGAISVGTTLALSGYFMRYALKNPLADSSILGIQTGATTLTLIILLYFPLMYYLVPVVAFIGGIIAFIITVLITGKYNINSSSLILSGIIVNAFFTAIIGILTILNPIKLQGALNYLNGSLTSINQTESVIMLGLTIILTIGCFILIPILKILLLDDIAISNLGVSARLYRLGCAVYAILLASITVAFVGVISFIGIIIPEFASKLTNDKIKSELITTALLGSIVVLGSDLLQRIIFNPLDIPVGLVIGIGAAPLFLIVLRRNNYGN